ncbi:MAG: ABC transporter permease [Geminicoccaceae bacterium]|nr:ABC transporter permease [Geminicoccaceae bacterium]
MLAFVVRRVLLAVPVMIMVATFVFLIMQLGTSDPAAVLAGDLATDAQIVAIRERYGFDQPVWVQLFKWFALLAQGDLGTSIYTQMPVTRLIGQRLEATVALAVYAMVVAILLAVPLGTIAAWKAGSWIDRAVMIFAVSAFSFPVFLISYTLILVFALELGLFPVQGYQPLARGIGPFLEYLTLPAISLGLAFAALLARMTRASVLDMLRQDFVRTARAKGLRTWRVLVHHALRNAAVPIVTVIGLGLAALISGVVITETVFAIPGIGRLTVDGILTRDYPVVQGVVLFFSFVYVLLNLAIDVIYAVVDPRIRY